MKLFGRLRTYDVETRAGTIRPDEGGAPIAFEKAAVSWRDADTPEVHARLSYYLGQNAQGVPLALNLRPA
jgi:cold shock CspA family protein